MRSGFDYNKGIWVFWSFVAFFGVIVAVNSVFIYQALSTHSGLVTEQPYRKGLAYNELLDKARSQPKIEHTVSFEDGVLRWALPKELAEQGAHVKASFLRPVKDGYDFDATLSHIGEGVHEVRPQLLLPGNWVVNLKATWKTQTFQTRTDLIIR